MYTDLAVLDEPENVLEAVIVQKNGLQHRSVGTLQDLRDGIYRRTQCYNIYSNALK